MGMKALLARLPSRLRRNRELEAKVAEKNEIIRKVRRQVAKRDQELTRLRAELTEVKIGEHSQNFSSERTPVFFVLGRGRSGTTWLRSILNSHPEILCWGEGRFFERSFMREDFEQLQLENLPPSSLYRAILESRDFESLDKRIGLGEG
jgi:uncharacterized coiled-coil protein SlyX